MLTLRSFSLAAPIAGLTALVCLTGCPKKVDLTIPDGGLLVINIDAGSAVADAAVADTTDAAAALPTTTTTTPVTAAHVGCAAGQTAFVVDGKPACETRCNTSGKGNSGECTEPSVCIGVAPLGGADAGAALGEYCRTPPSGACPQTNMAQFWGGGGKPTCEIMCNTPTDSTCPAPMTCKGNGQLYMVNGKMGEPHRYCRK